MNLLICLQVIFCWIPPLQFYDISFTDTDGQQIKMSKFKGSRVLIISFDAPTASKTDFKYWDSIQNAYSDLQIIAVPAIDSKGSKGEAAVSNAKASIKSKIIVAATGDLKRNAEKYQHPLFQWLTNSENNLLINIEGVADQCFIVSAKGTLFAVVEGIPSRSYLQEILTTPFDESNQYILNPETHFYEPKR